AALRGWTFPRTFTRRRSPMPRCLRRARCRHGRATTTRAARAMCWRSAAISAQAARCACVAKPQGVHVPRNLEPLLARATVLAVGPGLGQDEWGRGLWNAALDAGKPLVLDADGLNLLAAAPRTLPSACVLTPHPGEAA